MQRMQTLEPQVAQALGPPTDPTFAVPLPMVQLIRHLHQTTQLNMLHTVLALPVDGPQHEHKLMFNVDDMTVADMRRCPHSAQTLAYSAAMIPPEKQVERQLSFRERIHALVSDPTSSRIALLLSVFIMLCICATTLAYCYESMPDVPADQATADVLQMIEMVTSIVFTVEYGIRLLTCANLRKFLLSPLNLIDFLAIVPFYVTVILNTAVGALLSRVRIECGMSLLASINAALFKLSVADSHKSAALQVIQGLVLLRSCVSCGWCVCSGLSSSELATTS